jgi:hypothetical protein
MNNRLLFAGAAVLVATVVRGAPAPDFWYVVPGEKPAANASGLVRGLVVPSMAHPTVQTTPEGSVVSWRRPDGTTQSVVVRGVSSLTFEPGPLAGTTYVPFARAKRFQYAPDACCTCASWQNSVESVEALSCVAGCLGCGCEGCICSPTFPCPDGPPGLTALVAHGAPGTNGGITIAGPGRTPVSFRGRRLSVNVTPQGETVIDAPDSITFPGKVATRASIRGDKALFAWWSADASVILEQPRSMPAPTFQDGTIELESRPAGASATAVKRLAAEPVMDRCKACGTHPNSIADLDIYDCVPGEGVCYRCVSWECFAPES